MNFHLVPWLIVIRSAMDVAEQQTKTEPDLSHMLEIKPATKIMHLMFSFINTALIPLSQTSLTTRREMVKLSNTTLASLETKINNIIQKTVNGRFLSPSAQASGLIDISCYCVHWIVARQTKEARLQAEG
jgi:hypothetical protein